MKKKQVGTLIAATAMSTALLGGCGIDSFVEDQQEMLLYGPPPISREDIEKEESHEELDESEELPEVGDFKPELEHEIEVYGPAPDLWN